MTILASDPFTGTGNISLSANWTASTISGLKPVLFNNEAYDNNGTALAVAYYSAVPVWPNDGYAEVVIGSVLAAQVDEGVGPAFRIQDPTTGGMYLAQSSSTETRLYVTPTGAAFTQLGNDAAPCAPGDRLRIVCRGNQISAMINGATVIGPVTDTTLTSGVAGVWTTPKPSVAPGTVASWEAGDLLGPTFTVQPTDATVPAGAGVTFSVTATGNGTVTYQWQDDGGSPGTFANISGANSSTLSFIADGARDGRHFRVNATDNDGTVASNRVTLRVLVGIATAMPLGDGPWVPRDNVPPRLWGPLLDVRAWLPGSVPLQIQKWWADWLEVPPAPGAVTINCTVGNLALGNVSAKVALTTVIRGTVASLTLGSVSARVQLATAINAAKATLQLNGTPAKVVLTTVVRGAPGSLVLGGVKANPATTMVVRAIPGNLTLGAVAARVQLATAINAVKSALQLNGTPARVQVATAINTVRGNLQLGGVRALIPAATIIQATPGILTLGSAQAKVAQPTVINTVRGVLTLGRVNAQVQVATTVKGTPGSLTLGRVNAKVQLATAVNTAPGNLQLNGKAAAVVVHETTTINCRVGGMTLGGTPAQITTIAPPAPAPVVPRTFGGGGGPGQLIVRRKRVRVAIHDTIEDRTVIVARTTAAIKPLASQIAAIVAAVSDSAQVVQRAHWTPARASIHAVDAGITDVVVAKVHASDPDLLEFFDLLMEADA